MTDISKDVADYPAPWDLQGRGYMLIYRFSREFARKDAFLKPAWKDRFAGGLGAVMLIDYQQSNAGPYQELLFIPGKFNTPFGQWHNIPKIYVSTMESVVNGRRNWAIPKERADFEFRSETGGGESISVKADGVPIFDVAFRAFGPRFPVDTRLLPFPLMQEAEQNFLQTSFFGKGKGKLCRLESIKVNRKYFPDVTHSRPLAVVRIDPFKLTFPVAREYII